MLTWLVAIIRVKPYFKEIIIILYYAYKYYKACIIKFNYYSGLTFSPLGICGNKMVDNNHHIYDNMIMKAFIKPQYLAPIIAATKSLEVGWFLDGEKLALVKTCPEEVQDWTMIDYLRWDLTEMEWSWSSWNCLKLYQKNHLFYKKLYCSFRNLKTAKNS